MARVRGSIFLELTTFAADRTLLSHAKLTPASVLFFLAAALRALTAEGRGAKDLMSGKSSLNAHHRTLPRKTSVRHRQALTDT